MKKKERKKERQKKEEKRKKDHCTHLGQLAVFRELIGDLPDPGHAGVDKLYGEVPVLVGHDAYFWRWAQVRILKCINLVIELVSVIAS